MDVRYFATAAGRSQAVSFLDGATEDARAAILADIEALRQYGDRAPVQMKPIKGHRPMMEIKTGGFRTLFVRKRGTIWILHICKKQDQRRGIEAAHTRMVQLEELE